MLAKLTEPLLPEPVPKLKLLAPWMTTLPEAVRVLPDSLKVEFVMLPPVPLNLAMTPLVPLPVMPPPVPTQFPKLSRQTVSVAPPAIVGIWIVALPLPLGLRPCRTTSRVLEALARFKLPIVLPAIPTVMPPAPWTASPAPPRWGSRARAPAG